MTLAVLEGTANRRLVEEGAIPLPSDASHRLPMQVRYGNISARCADCGGRQFELIAPQKALQPTSLFSCYQCGAHAFHGELIARIGDEAMRRAQVGIATLKERHAQNRKRIAVLRACLEAPLSPPPGLRPPADAEAGR
jgi:hypothetical protein